MFWDDKIHNYYVMDNLIANFATIKQEMLTYINIPDILQDYPNYKVRDNKHIFEKYWKATPCSVFRDEHLEMHETQEVKDLARYLVQCFRKHCPITYSIIKPDEDQEKLFNSFISRLIPGSIINTHAGWTYKYMRIHLCLTEDPDCKITVNDQTRTWEEGKFLAFNDGDPHGVVHNGTQERVVFSFDVTQEHIHQFI